VAVRSMLTGQDTAELTARIDRAAGDPPDRLHPRTSAGLLTRGPQDTSRRQSGSHLEAELLAPGVRSGKPDLSGHATEDRVGSDRSTEAPTLGEEGRRRRSAQRSGVSCLQLGERSLIEPSASASVRATLGSGPAPRVSGLGPLQSRMRPAYLPDVGKRNPAGHASLALNP
jgi:hypothetical protein